ncbi:MAG: hypothetical protein LUG83_00720 [Lachnospiraceae bacterium]|nr:hypothetical protein [Lachnospiraceae bacterium]
MSDITTYTGKHINPAAPDINLIDIRDIAHALSLICRGNGHVKTFFSVGQHCINCALEAEARGFSDRIVMACLIHDASECYMSDVPRPFKRILTEYQKYEEKLLDIIYNKFLGSSLTCEEEKMVKQIDDDMLYFDLIELLNEKSEGLEPVMKSRFSYDVVSFETVEKKYLDLYTKYSYKL